MIKRVLKEEKKNGAHTHARTTVQLESAIFTSVVVYSRTSRTKHQQINTCVLKNKMHFDLMFRYATTVVLLKREKKTEHTYVCTTVQLDERNIHVGCCLFSHNK